MNILSKIAKFINSSDNDYLRYRNVKIGNKYVSLYHNTHFNRSECTIYTIININHNIIYSKYMMFDTQGHEYYGEIELNENEIYEPNSKLRLIHVNKPV